MIEFDINGEKICIWKNEEVYEHVQSEYLEIKVPSGNSCWYNGTICMEVKLHPRHISNYAMLCIKYVPGKKAETNVRIYSTEKIEFESKVLPFGRCIHIGLLKEFEEAIEEFFEGCSEEILPSGSIEILYGGFDEVGSSKYSFKKAMELLVCIFQNIETVSEEELMQVLEKKL